MKGTEMHVRVNHEALDLAFRTLLTCECPVTKDQECRIFELLKNSGPDDAIEYDRVLEIFKPNENTVFRRLLDFASWSASTEGFVITRDHVVRHFASSFHWNQVVAVGISNAYKKVLHVPSWFLGHMLLPVTVTNVKSDAVSVAYEFDGGKVLFHHLFAHSESCPKPGETWAIHFAGLLSRLTPEEERAARLMNDMNPFLVQFRHDVGEVDYTRFQRDGDYLLAHCRGRYEKHYSTGTNRSTPTTTRA